MVSWKVHSVLKLGELSKLVMNGLSEVSKNSDKKNANAERCFGALQKGRGEGYRNPLPLP